MNDRTFVDGDDMSDDEVTELLIELGGRLGPEEPALMTPPEDLWAVIERQLDREVPDGVEPARLSQEPSSVTSLDHHRRRRRPPGILLGAVAASLLVAVAVGALVNRNGRSILSETELASLGTQERFGTATLVDEDGAIRLDIDLAERLVAEEGQFFELWIIDTQVEGMYSLGPISSDGSYSVPSGIDVSEFPIVDISAEPDDGNPAHSGTSVYRGTLDF